MAIYDMKILKSLTRGVQTMKEMLQELKNKEFSFRECRERFDEFWSKFQNVISMEHTRFLGNAIKIDPGKKSTTALYFELFNFPLVLSYYPVKTESEYRCILLLEYIWPDGKREYISHCYFDQKGNIYLKLEDTTSELNLSSDYFALNFINDTSNKLISAKSAQAKELEEKTES
ncbi:MAG: hypothetical protein R6U22_05420 [Desulfohalobiaceae bacterium]